MTKRLFKGFSLLTILALMLMAVPMQSALAAGTISLTTIGSAYAENFDTLSNVAGSTTNNLTINGWYLTESGGGARDNEQYAVDTGGSTTGDMYSYGAAASTERALGELRSGTLIPIFGANFVNNTGSTITALDIAYTGEEWRLGTAARIDQMNFEYSTNATDLVTGTWTAVASLNFVTPDTATIGAKNGNAAADRTAISGTISGLNIANGATFWIRWTDTDASGADDGLAVDDFSVTPQSVVLPNLTINDVSLNEGNSGPTSFNFTVSLSAAAGPGGVTFDIATADGTAQDDNPATEDNDYVAQSLTAQSIPVGSSGPFNFNVTVNGDAVDEPNETFLVNVTNVSGATVGDGQGQGTIQNDDTPTQPPAGSVVISEVYGGGGNASAPFKNDYIELYNRTASPISLAGWSVQYASAAGNTWQVTALSGSIAPGRYYLVAESAGTSCSGLPCGVDLPTPEATGTILMSGTAGKVALVQNTTPLSGTCPTGLPISDFAGYGTTANCFEGTGPTPTPSNTASVIRLAGGATDTDNNAADFVAGAPDPDNGADTAPTVASTTPVNGAANVLVGSNIDVTFSEPVNATSSSFTVSCGTSGTHTVAVTGGPTTFNLNPDTDFVTTETCTVTVVAAQVTDQDTDDPPDNMAADFGFSFSTEGPVCSQTFTPIYSIEGSGATAAITGNVTTQGVVVGDFEGTASASGFYIQDATGDGNPATSDGIFVFTGAANTVSVGDLVRVTGFARERFSQTTLNGSNADSAAVPAGNIVNCGTGTAPVTDVSLPFASATFPEQYEGMLVRVPQPLVIAEYFNYARFGEMVLALPLDGESRPFSGTAIDEPGAAANARTLANSLSRITLDDAQSAQNPPVLRHPNGTPFSLSNLFRGGDTVQNAVGVLGFDFSLYRIFPTGPADYTSANPRPVSPEPVGGTLRVAAMNTLNFFVTLDTTTSDTGPGPCGANQNLDCRGADADQPLEFTRQRDKLLTALTGLNGDIIGLNELESTPGAEPLDSIVSGMPGYDYIHTGPIGTDAIKVGIIYRPAVVTPVGAFKLLTSAVDPRFIDTKSRPSLAQTFEVNATGARFTVVVNHFKSKGSDCNDIGDPDLLDGQGNCSQTRKKAAQALVDWIATDPTGSGDPDFLIVGDLNSYAQEESIDAIKAGADDTSLTSDDYTNLISHFHGAYAYSYTFDGQAGYLDYAIANASIFSQVTGAADWHINSDEPSILDYDTSFKPPAQEALYAVDPYRTSDHDAVVVGLDLTETIPPDTSIDSNPSNPSNSSSASFTFSGTDNATAPGNLTFECDLDGGGFSSCTSPQNYNSLSDGSHTFQVRATDEDDNSDPTPASFTWTIDTTPPNTAINSNPSNPSNSNSASFSFSGTDSGTGIASFECKLDGGSFGSCTSPQTYTSLADGSHTFQVRAIDGAGNVDATPASFTWTIDVTAPNTTINSNPAVLTNSTSASFSFSGTDAGTGVASFECKLDAGSFSACTSPKSYSSLADGGHTFQVRAIDAVGNVDPTPASFTWTIDTVAPTISVAAGGMCSSSGGTVNLTVADSSGNPLALSGSSSNTTAVPNGNILFGGSGSNRTVAITAVSGSSVRTATVTITVSDGVNTASTTITVTIGTSGNNTALNGTSGADLILGLDGNDTLNGLGGNDLLCGGAKNDTLNGGGDNDTVYGEAGNDVLTGSTGANSFSGGPGNDTNTDFNAGQGDTSDGT